MFKEYVKNNYTIIIDSWYSECKIVTDGNELQIDVGSAQQVKAPNFLIAVHQTEARIGNLNKKDKRAVFDHVDVSFFVKKMVIDIQNAVLTNVSENDCFDQYRDLNLFHKEYVGEESMNLFISYTDMKNKYPIQIIDLRFQVDHLTPKNIQLFEEYKTDPFYPNIRVFVILIRHTQMELVSDGNKFIEIKVK